MKTIRLIEVPSELGAGTRGASLGIEAIKLASLSFNSKLFQGLKNHRVETENELLFEMDQFPWAHRINGIVEVCRRLADTVSDTLLAGEFPIVLTGDHSNAIGTIGGIKKAFADQRLGIIWIDAHADLHTPYTTPSGNVHGMPLACALHTDNAEKQNRIPSEKTIALWSELKNTGTSQPKVLPQDIVFIGLRDFEEEEDYLIKKYNIQVIDMALVHEHGAEAMVGRALQHLEECDIVYVSFDVDSQDPAFSRGTGTPVPGGFSEDEAISLVTNLMTDERVKCFEISEVNPLLDNMNQTGKNAFKILDQTVLSLKPRLN